MTNVAYKYKPKEEIKNNKDNVIHVKIRQLHQMPIAPCMRATQKDWEWNGVF